MPSIGLGIGVAWARPSLIASYDAAAQGYFDRMTVSPDAARRSAINDVVFDLKASGAFGLMDVLYLMAAHDAQAARQNVVQDLYNLVAVNAPGFVVDRGFASDGSSSYLSSGQNLATMGQFSLNTAHMGLWQVESFVGGGAFPIGTLGATLAPRQTSDAWQYRLNAAATVNLGAAASADWRHFASNRLSADTIDLWGAGLKRFAALAHASSAVSSQVAAVCARNIGTGYQYGAHRLAAAHWGAGLSDAQHVAVYATLRKYLTAVGAPPP